MENLGVIYIHEVDGALGCQNTVPKSPKGFGEVFEVPCSKVDNLHDYCSGLLKGVLLSKGLSISSVVFQPADSDDEQLRGLHGFPVTAFRSISPTGKEYYEFHIFFDTKVHTRRILGQSSSKEWR